MTRCLILCCGVLLANAVRVLAALPNQPLCFEPNQGQADPDVKFLSRAPGYTLLLTASEVALVDRDSSRLRMKLVGANRQAKIQGLDRLPGVRNYFLGNDRSKWRTRIPTYARVALREVYPGIDLVFYGNREELEYDWLVAPGADPNRIRVKLDGAAGMRPESNGDLRVNADVRQRKPVVYQIVSGQRKEVESGYSVRGREVAFHVGDYDANSPLIIDPSLAYTTLLGGSGQSNIGEGVAVDAAGNAYVTGYTDSPNFPTLNPFKRGFQGTPTTGFVTKISAAGTLIYSTYLGGFGYDQAQSIAVDGAGNAYVAGIAGSSDFPTVNALQARPAGAGDAFVTKLSPDGSKLLYSTYLGGSGADFCYSIAVDPGGNAYVTGYTLSKDFPAVNAQQASFAGLADVFVSKLNPAGSALIYSTFLGGGNTNRATAIAVDPGGAAYIAGYTNSMDFPTANALQRKYGGGLWTGFAAKLDSGGSTLYSTYLGGASVSLTGDRAFAIAADAAGNAYVVGNTSSPDFPMPPGGPAGSNVERTFVTKITSAGALGYTTYIPGTVAGVGNDRGSGIAVDLAGNAYVTGIATGVAPLPTTPDALQGTFGGGIRDAFLTKISADGSTRLYSTYLGGNDQDQATGIAVRGSDAYVAGYMASSDFPGANTPQDGAPGRYPAFVVRIAGDAPRISTIANGASGLSGPIAPGEWITIEGSQLGPPDGASYIVNPDGTVDSSLAGVQVLFDTIPGTPTYVSDGVINVIAPYEIADRDSTNVSVIYRQAVSAPSPQTVAAVSPAIYRVINANGTQNGPPGAGAEPAPAGSVISVYATGGGQTDPPSATGSVNPMDPLLLADSVTATIGGQQAPVIFAGASAGDLTGMLRLDIRTPAATGDALPIRIAIDTVSSPAGPSIAVR